MRQLSFDIFDFNNDNKISEGDLFRIMKSFTLNETDVTGLNPTEVFEQSFQKDFLTMSRYIQVKK